MKTLFELDNQTLTASAIAMVLILWMLVPSANDDTTQRQVQAAIAQDTSSSALEVNARLAGNRQRLLALSEQMAQLEGGLKRTEQELLEVSSCQDC